MDEIGSHSIHKRTIYITWVALVASCIALLVFTPLLGRGRNPLAAQGEKLDLLRLDGLGEGGLIRHYGSVRTENIIPVRSRTHHINISFIWGIVKI